MFQQAVAFHRSGQLTEAEKLYRTILQVCPNHSDANHNIGVLAVHAGQPAAGLPYFLAALEANPASGQYWLSYAEALFRAGQQEAAQQVLAHAQKHGLQGNEVDALASLLSGSDATDGTPPPRFDIQNMDTLVALFNSGRYAEMETVARGMTKRSPNDGIGWKAMGAALLQQGRHAEALHPLQKAASLLGEDAETYDNLGNAFLHLSRLPEAETSYRHALKIRPNYAEVHSKLGNTLRSQGRFADAEACYRRALEVKPGYAEAYYNLGISFQEQGRLGEAEDNYRHALKIRPDYAEAYNNLGTSLWKQGRFREAEDSYRRALEIKPDFPEGLGNLALVLSAGNDPAAALDLAIRSLRLGETQKVRDVFVSCARRLKFRDGNAAIRDLLVRAISEPWCKPSDLARTGADFVKSTPDIGECVSRAAEAWPQRLPMQQLLGSKGIAPVASDPLLRALLNSAPICDIELEQFLTMVRRGLLDTAIEAPASAADTATLDFYGSLAQQCFINEYVFALTDDEVGRAYELRDSLAAALAAESPVPAIWPVAVAAYFPLHSLPLADHLLGKAWPDTVSAILVQQIREPAEERQYRPLIPRLTPIEDGVSLQVRSQYEENPYPRWIKASPAGDPVAVDEFLHKSFPLADLRPFGKDAPPDILIGGCGTGLHSIMVARRFHNARILAIDLSLTSLCYARRKAQELALDKIEYAQADILKMGEIGRSFDIIESVGVLHHLQDPMAGWQILLSLLRAGGIMKLGFYSELARRDIVRARCFIAKQGYASTDEDIRRCRQDLVDSDPSMNWGLATRSEDFFSTSTCRDLLFHVQEHRMTLADIGAFLGRNNLKLLGFETDAHTLHTFRLRFPDALATTDLVCWQAFEKSNPDTFFGMYQFWVQKSG